MSVYTVWFQYKTARGTKFWEIVMASSSIDAAAKATQGLKAQGIDTSKLQLDNVTLG